MNISFDAKKNFSTSKTKPMFIVLSLKYCTTFFVTNVNTTHYPKPLTQALWMEEDANKT